MSDLAVCIYNALPDPETVFIPKQSQNPVRSDVDLPQSENHQRDTPNSSPSRDLLHAILTELPPCFGNHDSPLFVVRVQRLVL